MQGYQVGDDVFVVVGYCIVGCLCCLVDYVVCYGGEEFVVVLLDIDLDGVVMIVEMICMGVFDFGICYDVGMVGWLMVSIGVMISYFECDDNIQVVFKLVDDVLYWVKEGGCNCIVVQVVMLFDDCQLWWV